MTTLKALKLAALAEAVSVCLLFANLFTVHWPAVSSVLGPLHGTAYLVSIVCAFSVVGATGRTKPAGVRTGNRRLPRGAQSAEG